MGVTREHFGETASGEEISLFTLTSERIRARVMDYGAVLVNLFVPDKNGEMADVVLGYDQVERYFANDWSLGSSVGPIANRTAGASFALDGEVFHMPANEGPNNLHSDKKFNRRMWSAEEIENGVSFHLELPDGECGLPGDRFFTISYTLVGNDLRIDYHVTSDRKTVLNPTNHSYFNLAGENSGSCLGQVVQLFAGAFTPVGEGSIPTGEIRRVQGTPFDFTSPKPIGRDIDAEDEQLALTGGYDHNFVIDGYRGDGSLQLFARVSDPVSGRVMEGLTTLPGVQFYTSNGMEIAGGKGDRTYRSREAFCLETQYYPDTIHHGNFPQNVFGPEHPYDATTIYRFPEI